MVADEGVERDDSDELRVLPENVQVEVLSFCDASDFLSLKSFFDASAEAAAVAPATTSPATQLERFLTVAGVNSHLAATESLGLSYLLRACPNRFQDDHGSQERAVTSVIEVAVKSADDCTTNKEEENGKSKEPKLKHLELANLRSVTGVGWLQRLSKVSLVSLDLTNCERLNPELLASYLVQCPTILRHLNLSGCTRVGPDIVSTIGTRHHGLESLSLGCCSQAIRMDNIYQVLQGCTKLRHIDFQGLSHLQDAQPNKFSTVLPNSVQSLNLSGCTYHTMDSREAFALLLDYVTEIRQADTAQHEAACHDFWNSRDAPPFRLENLFLNCTGQSARRGLSPGVLAHFALGRRLKEVHLGGCDNMAFEEIQALAFTCGETLTVFQMRAGSLCDRGLSVLAKNCPKLGELDICACAGVSDDGILALCRAWSATTAEATIDGNADARVVSHERDGFYDETLLTGSRKRQKIQDRSALTVLRIGSLPKLTDRSIYALCNLQSLILLDIHDCPKITSTAVCATVRQLPRLVEVDAKDVKEYQLLNAMLRYNPNSTQTLQFVNQRCFNGPAKEMKEELTRRCCSVRVQSQRLSSAQVPLRPMYHCITCDLIPELDRGMCANCVHTCHKGHKTFLGVYTRYFCDCPFGFVPDHSCHALVPADVSVGLAGVRCNGTPFESICLRSKR